MAYMDVNGVKLYYEEKGNSNAKETVVFINGVMASANSWEMQLSVFEKHFKVIVFDLKGQLLSEKPVGPYTFKDHAMETIGLLEALNINNAHFIGTSYGGEVALRLAIDFPEQVKSISIIDSVSELDEVLKLFVQGWKSAALEGNIENFYWGMAPTIYHNDFLVSHMDILKERAIALKKAPKDYFIGQIYLYDTFLEDVTITDELYKIKCPTLIVCGEQDILKPRKFSEIIAQNISGSEFAIIPNCGHVTIFEKPDVLNSLLLGFVVKQM